MLPHLSLSPLPLRVSNEEKEKKSVSPHDSQFHGRTQESRRVGSFCFQADQNVLF